MCHFLSVGFAMYHCVNQQQVITEIFIYKAYLESRFYQRSYVIQIWSSMN